MKWWLTDDDPDPSDRLNVETQPAGGRLWHQIRQWVPNLAVLAVVLAATAAALMTTHFHSQPGGNGVTLASAPKAPAQPVQQSAKAAAESSQCAASLPRQVQTHVNGSREPDITCRSCGVVERVVAVSSQGRSQSIGYLIQIRMDDGSLRRIEQPCAIPAGSRVVIKDAMVRAAAEQG